jgi:hypothetical protein
MTDLEESIEEGGSADFIANLCATGDDALEATVKSKMTWRLLGSISHGGEPYGKSREIAAGM